MSVKNALLRPDNEKLAAAENVSPADSPPAIQSRKADLDETEGSVWSHLLFGLGMLALVSPLFITGIPMNMLMVAYVGLTGVLLVGCIIWNFLNARPPKG